MRRRGIVLVFLSSLSVLTFLDRLCIAVAGPRIQRDLALTPELWGWVLGAFALAYGLFEIPSGAAGDRTGPRRALSRIVLWWSCFTALTGAAAGFLSLLATQFLFGAGEAGAYPNAAGVIARWFPPRERARARGVVWASSRLGGALAPLLIVPLLGIVSWRATFLLLGAVGVVWALFWRAWFHDHPNEQPGITAAELAEIGTPHSHAGRHNVLWRSFLAHRQIWLLAAMYWCYVWASWFYFTWFPTYLVRGAGFTEREMALVSALPFLLGCCGNLAGGALSDRLTVRFGAKIGRSALGSASLATSSALILALALSSHKRGVILLSSAGFGVLDLMLPAAGSACVDISRAYAGLVSAVMNSSGLFGGFVCTVLFGHLVRRTGSYRAPIALIAVMVLASAILFLCVDPTKPLPETEPEASSRSAAA